MAGLKSLIRYRIPVSWEYVILRHKMMTRYLEIVHKTHFPNSHCGRVNVKPIAESIRKSMKEIHETGVSDCFWHSANFDKLSKDEKEFNLWKKINSDIQNYKINCN